jgi:hypothetical protein
VKAKDLVLVRVDEISEWIAVKGFFGRGIGGVGVGVWVSVGDLSLVLDLGEDCRIG